MTPRLLQNIDATTCRLCSAIRAKRDKKSSAILCAHCWGRYESALSGMPHSDVAFDHWLARQVVLNVRRLEIYGVMGRCEAVSRHAEFTMSGGHQCGNYACARRKGRRVCASHSRSLSVEFVDNQENDQYAIFRTMAIEVGRRDEKFRKALSEVYAALQ